MAARKAPSPTLQPYPREKGGGLLADDSLFPPPDSPISEAALLQAVDGAFARCIKDKKGDAKPLPDSPEQLVELCIRHLRERSDPVLSPYFVGQLKAEDLFELDAVSHEMQRHRMSIGVFYQYLILELMRLRWPVFDGSREGDIVADMDTPGFESGIRVYMSVKKSKDTVGGQDIGGVIRRLEALPKEEKNLTRPYLCVLCVATPSKGKLHGYDDRQIKCNKDGQPFSLNCEYWGPGFIFPYVTGWSPVAVYRNAYKQVANYFPFMSLRYREECAVLLRERLDEMALLDSDGTVNPEKFLLFTVGSHHD